MTTYGTHFFVSRAAAIKYYRDYEQDPARAVEVKCREGSIAIGVPVVKRGQSLIVIDNGTRYAIQEVSHE